MRQGKQTMLNILMAVAYQAVTAVCSLILPKFILQHYGSEANGLMQAVGQILSYTILLEGGIGGVMRAALYKPLAEKNEEAISNIFHGIKDFFVKISLVFIAFAVVLSVTTKLIVATEFDWLYVCTMVLILSMNTYLGYYFAMPHQLLMRADQKLYVIQFSQIVTTVLNLGVSILVMSLGAGLHVVKFLSAFVFLLNPLVFRFYVRRHYKISEKTKTVSHALPRKRDGAIHQAAYFVHHNTDVVILSIFADLRSVSVYSVYNAVILCMEQLLSSISNGVSGAIGSLIAREEKESLKRTFSIYESVNTALTTAFSVVAAILILPFVSIYTSGIHDVQYRQPLFALLMICAGFMYCVRLPYNTVISAAGHYAQTKPGAIGEVTINLLLSLVLVRPLGIVGVAAGTLAAMTFRTVYTVWYLAKDILHRPGRIFARITLLNVTLGVLLVFVYNRFVGIQATSIWELIVDAVKVSAVVFPLFGALNIALEKELASSVRSLLKKCRR